MTTTKELKLVFKNADGKHKNLVISKPVENVDEEAVKEIGDALKTLMKETVSYVTVVSHYRHTIG